MADAGVKFLAFLSSRRRRKRPQGIFAEFRRRHGRERRNNFSPLLRRRVTLDFLCVQSLEMHETGKRTIFAASHRSPEILPIRLPSLWCWKR